MVGCDIREMSEQTKAVLTNRELLAINQDTACRQPYPIKGIWQDSVTAYAKNLAGGDIATVPYKVIEQMVHHPLTDQGIDKFQKDYIAVFGE